METPGEVEQPTTEGWWARGSGRRKTEWFYVETFDDGTPPSIWVPGIEDFVPVAKFTRPLLRWWGPVVIPFEP